MPHYFCMYQYQFFQSQVLESLISAQIADVTSPIYKHPISAKIREMTVHPYYQPDPPLEFAPPRFSGMQAVASQPSTEASQLQTGVQAGVASGTNAVNNKTGASNFAADNRIGTQNTAAGPASATYTSENRTGVASSSSYIRAGASTNITDNKTGASTTNITDNKTGVSRASGQVQGFVTPAAQTLDNKTGSARMQVTHTLDNKTGAEKYPSQPVGPSSTHSLGGGGAGDTRVGDREAALRQGAAAQGSSVSRTSLQGKDERLLLTAKNPAALLESARRAAIESDSRFREMDRILQYVRERNLQ